MQMIQSLVKFQNNHEAILCPQNITMAAILEKKQPFGSVLSKSWTLSLGVSPYYFMGPWHQRLVRGERLSIFSELKEWDSHVSPLALKAIRFRHLYLENAPCPVSPFIHHRPYNVWKKYAAVSIIFHGCHRLSAPFVLEPYSSCNSFG